MVTNATIHKLPKIDFLTVYLSRAVPHCQAIGSVSIYVSPAKSIFLFCLFCFVHLLYFSLLCDIGSCCQELMSSMAVVVYAGKHQRRDPEQCLTFKSIKKSLFTHFRLPSLPWLRSAEARSAARDIRSWGEHWGPNFTSALGEKGKHRSQSLFREIASKFKIARSTPLVTHLAARCNGVSSSLPIQFTSAPMLNKSYKGNFEWTFSTQQWLKG